MQGKWILPLLCALIAGALMPAQGAANSWLARRSSLAMATLWTHATAGLLVGLVLLVLPSTRGSWPALWHSPLPALLGGLMGAGITWLVASAVEPLGMVSATTGILVAQIVTAALLDHFGLFGLERTIFSLSKGAGALLLVLGAWLLLRK